MISSPVNLERSLDSRNKAARPLALGRNFARRRKPRGGGREKEKQSEEKEERGGIGWTVKSPLPRESKKRSPRRERGPLCARGSELFCGVSKRLAEGGRRLNVDESRAAGKPSSPLFLVGLVEGEGESSMTIGMRVLVAHSYLDIYMYIYFDGEEKYGFYFVEAV